MATATPDGPRPDPNRFLPHPRQARRLLWWIMGLFALRLVWNGLPGAAAIIFGVYVFLPAAAIWWVVLVIAGIVDGWTMRVRPVAALATMLLFPVAAFFLWQPIGRASVWVHFLIDRPAYERTIAGLRSGTIPHESQGFAGRHDPAFVVDESVPLRVAFPTFVGIPDNWSAIVHDPTHSVRLVDRFGERTPAHVRELFGGDLQACWRLSGSYYSCSFS